VNGARVTTVARTAIDLARVLPFMDAVVVADAAVRWRTGGEPRLRAVLGACERWPGADGARRVVAFANGLAESPLESRARVVFDAFGLPEPELQARITAGVTFRPDGTFRVDEYHEYRVDFLWRQHRTVAEADGKEKYYSGGRIAIDELKRDRLIREQGYKIVHITSAELDKHPERIIDRIRTAFTAPSAY
jgi:very-short-patch-repair endonuclease